MKTAYIIGIFLAFSYTTAFGQFTTPGSRGISVKFIPEEKNLLWVDFREGLIMPCDTANKDYEDRYTSFDFLGSRWNLYSTFINEGLINLVRDGHNLNDWQEMITIMRVDTEGKSAQKVHRTLLKQREKNCPGKTYYSNVIEETKKHILYESKSDKCGPFEAQSEIKKIIEPPTILFQYTIWIVEYTKRNGDFDEASRTEIINWLQSVKILTGKELKAYFDNQSAAAK